MGRYENKIAIESCVKTIHKQQCTEHKAQYMIDELEMVYDKAKAFDEILNMEDPFIKYNGIEYYAEEVQEIINEYLEDE